MAKVTADVDKTAFKLGNGTDWDANKYGTKAPVGKSGDYDVYAVIDGWGLANENGKAEVEKQVKKTWTDGNLGFSPWTTADYHRCFGNLQLHLMQARAAISLLILSLTN